MRSCTRCQRRLRMPEAHLFLVNPSNTTIDFMTCGLTNWRTAKSWIKPTEQPETIVRVCLLIVLSEPISRSRDDWTDVAAAEHNACLYSSSHGHYRAIVLPITGHLVPWRAWCSFTLLTKTIAILNWTVLTRSYKLYMETSTSNPQSSKGFFWHLGRLVDSNLKFLFRMNYNCFEVYVIHVLIVSFIVDKHLSLTLTFCSKWNKMRWKPEKWNGMRWGEWIIARNGADLECL